MGEPLSVALFFTVDAVFRLQKALKARDVRCRAIPIPRRLSSDCGTALRFPTAAVATVQALAAELDIDLQGIHDAEKQ